LYGAQLAPAPEAPQVPEPLQTWGTRLEPWQSEAPQAVPEAKSWQAPAPSHWPLVPQVEAGCAEHSLSGSVPRAMGPQTPSAPEPFLAVVQALHRPVQAEPQQTPSTQKPVEQVAAVTHGVPAPAAGVVKESTAPKLVPSAF
jgi:hypothetical protein